MDFNTVHLFITLFTLQDTHQNCLTFKNIFYNIQQAFCYTNQSDFPFISNLYFLTALLLSKVSPILIRCVLFHRVLS